MKLSKRSIPYRALQKFAGLALFAFFLGGGAAEASGPLLAVGVFFAAIALGFVYEYLYWLNFEYSVDEEGLKIVSGVISRNDTDIPLKRIQNIDINRNIVQRVLDLAEVRIETAGGGSTEASLRFVGFEEAQRFQEKVRKLKNRREPEQKEKKDREGFRLSEENLALLSLSSVGRQTIGIALLMASLFGGALGSTLTGTTGIAAVLIGTFYIALAVTASIMVNAASVFSRFYGFELEFRENALEYERGLFNRASGTIPEEKIQGLVVEENFVQRYLGYATLKVETAGYSMVQESQGSDSETVIPLAKRSEVLEFAKRLDGGLPSEMESIQEEAKKRYTRRYLMVGALLVLGGSALRALTDIPGLILPGIAVIALSRNAAQYKWENIGFSLGEERFFTRKGFWNRRTYSVPYFRVQNLIETETVFQSRWSQSTLIMDTAGSMTSYPEIIDLDTEKCEKLKHQVYSRFKDSLR